METHKNTNARRKSCNHNFGGSTPNTGPKRKATFDPSVVDLSSSPALQGGSRPTRQTSPCPMAEQIVEPAALQYSQLRDFGKGYPKTFYNSSDKTAVNAATHFATMLAPCSGIKNAKKQEVRRLDPKGPVAIAILLTRDGQRSSVIKKELVLLVSHLECVVNLANNVSYDKCKDQKFWMSRWCESDELKFGLSNTLALAMVEQKVPTLFREMLQFNADEFVQSKLP
eukprot:gene10417-8367_t